MTALLQLTDQFNPLAQTFRVTEPGGSVLTSVGVFFQRGPATGEEQLPITLELRPTVNGTPSATRFIPGTRVVATAAAIRAIASETFSSSTEYKFTFKEPVYVPANVEMAIVLATSGKVGHYKVWSGTQGQHVAGSTTKLVTKDLNSGVLFRSSNGTVWTGDQTSDLAFKVYRASFNFQFNVAYMEVDTPPLKSLTENTITDNIIKYPADPLVFTGGSTTMSVIHPAHGFIVGDKVKLRSNSTALDSADTVNGVSGANLLKTHTITAVDAFGYSMTLAQSADSSIRAGGTSLLASEQYTIDGFKMVLPRITPPLTRMYAEGDFTTTTSIAGSETAYQTDTKIPIEFDNVTYFEDPHLAASREQEEAATRLNGEVSTKVRVTLETQNKYVAPYFNVNASSLNIISHFIDYQDSSGSANNRNAMSTLPYVIESNSDGGTTASKHLTIAYVLEDTATSIRVIVDAIKPEGTDFQCWFRTLAPGSESNIQEQAWVPFNLTNNPPNASNYNDRGFHDTFRQYEFNVFDILDFNTYQIKITLNSSRSTKVPIFTNLRTIATV